MESVLAQFLTIVLNSLKDQPPVVFLLISFIIFLVGTGYFVVHYLVGRIADLQSEQEEYRKMSKLLMKQALYKQSGVIDLDV